MTPTSLVTGGAGFLGSHLASYLLARGHRVVVMDDLSGGYRRNVPAGSEFVQETILNQRAVEELFARCQFDYVFHLAAYAAEGLSHFVRRYNYENNVVGSVTLINAAVNNNVKCFVFTSSAAVYGIGEGLLTNPAPADPYGIAKLTVEQDLQSATNLFGMPHVVFRPHNVYGPKQNLSDPFRNVIGIFFKQILSGEPCTIFGDGSQTRNFSFIEDVIPIIASSVEKPKSYGRAFDIGSDLPISLNELVAKMQAIMNVDVGVHHLPPRHEASHIRVNHEAARSMFGPVEETDLESGLRRTADWARTLEIGPQRADLRLEVEKELPPSWIQSLKIDEP